MSLHLGSRSSCSSSECECIVFIGEEPDGSPCYTDFERPGLPCAACGHTWLAHSSDPSGLSAANRRLMKGGAGNGCGGFHSTLDTWTMRTSCLCARAWSAHPRLGQTASTAAVQNTSLIAVSTSSSAVSPQRPVLAFAGIRRAPEPASTVAATVQLQRRESMQRTLPQHQPSNGLPSATNGRKKARLAGPPRSYSTPVATLDDFSTSSSASTAAMVPITIGILPKVLHTSDHHDTLDRSPSYSWNTSSELEKIQRRLASANLVFSVEANPSGPVFEQINTAFLDHCARQNIDFLAPPPTTANGEVLITPNNVAWRLTGAKGRAGNRTWVEDPKSLTRFTFTVSALRASPFNKTPNHLAEGIFLFIVPDLCNLRGPIDCLFEPAMRLPNHVLSHGCYARRVLYPVVSSLNDEPSPPTCGSSCPGNLTTGSISTSVDLTRPLIPMDYDEDSDMEDIYPAAEPLSDDLFADDPPSPSQLGEPTVSTQILTRAGRRRQWQEENAAESTVPTIPSFVPGPLLHSLMDSSSILTKSRSFVQGGPIDLTLQALPGAGLHSLVAWQNHMAEINGPADDDGLMLIAISVDLGARALIALCIWLHTVRQPPAIKFKEVLDEQFPAPRPEVEGTSTDVALFALHVKIGLGVGKGPRTEVIARALAIVTADPIYWADCGEYKTLRLHPSLSAIPRRSSFFKAAGLISMLHFVYVGAPIPLSPFVFSTLFNGSQTASRFDLDFLTRFVPRGSMTYIKKFHTTPLCHPLYTAPTEDCVEYQYLVNIPGVDPSLISHSRSKEEHEGVCASIISFVTLGTTSLASSSDFLSFADGFNVAIPKFGTYDQTHNVLEWFETPCKGLIVSTYDRPIKTVADVISNIVFTESNRGENPWGENAETMALIEKFICHYLTGRGHPHISGRILEALEIGDKDTDSHLTRARLFMAVMTGSTMLPVDPAWSVRVVVRHDWNEAYPCTQDDGREDFGPEVTASFHSCFRSVDITNNASLRHMLLAEDPVEGYDTKFCRWFHGQALSSRESYTAV